MSSSEHQKTPDVADTIAQAAAWVGLSVTELKAAKRAGCPAFSHGRVYMAKLRAWLDEQTGEASGDPTGLESKEKLERLALKARWQKLEFELAILRGDYISRADRDRSDTATAAAVRGQLMSLANEVPCWEGMPAHKLKTNIDAAVHGICANLHNRQSGAYKI